MYTGTLLKGELRFFSSLLARCKILCDFQLYNSNVLKRKSQQHQQCRMKDFTMLCK